MTSYKHSQREIVNFCPEISPKEDTVIYIYNTDNNITSGTLERDKKEETFTKEKEGRKTIQPLENFAAALKWLTDEQITFFVFIYF